MWLLWRIRWRAVTGQTAADSAAVRKKPILRGDFAPIVCRNVALLQRMQTGRVHAQAHVRVQQDLRRARGWDYL